MVAIKPAQADAFLARPNPGQPIILIYGPDRGRVSMRAKAAIASLTARAEVHGGEPAALIELDATRLETEPARLAEEADSVAMFGGHKLVVARMDDPKALTKTVDALLAAPPQDATIILVAGDLKKTHPLRSRIEKASTGAAIACYAADRRDIAVLIAQIVEGFKLTITAEARGDLMALLGSDHAMSRSEIEKLCLYAHDKGVIEREDVGDVLTDSSMQAMSDVADATYAGRHGPALHALQRSLAEGIDPSVLAQMLLRHGHNLERMRIEIDQGASAETVIGRARPMIFFKRRPAISAALQRWSSPRLRALLAHLDEQLAAIRLSADVRETRVERLVLRIASDAARARG